MKTMKIILSVIILAALIITAVVFYGLSNLNGFVEDIIESTGTEMTQTRVDVGSVDIQLTEGGGAIYNIAIANPKGYSSNALFHAKSVALTLDIDTVAEPVKVIERVDVGETTLRAEQKNIKDTNIQALLDNIKKSGANSKTTSSNDSETKIMIERIHFSAATIDLQTENFGGRSVALPAFSVRNIGNKKTEVTPQQAGQQITQQRMTKMKAAVSAELKNLVSEQAKAKAKEKIQEKLKENLSTDKLKSLFK